MDRSSRNRLNDRHLYFFDGDTLFDRIARTVCRTGCLPRKELFEAWETARRVRRRFRGGRVVDLACGHGLLSYILLILDDSSPEALAVDLHLPESACALASAMEENWPRLRGRVRFEQKDIEKIALTPDDLVVSVHACGRLTDLVLGRATDSGARLAVMPCCHNLEEGDMGDLHGWMDGPLAVDATRVARLRSRGYKVYTQAIPPDITPKNRLLLAEPAHCTLSRTRTAAV